MRLRFAGIASLTLSLLHARPALADVPGDEADVAFREGNELYAANRYAAAEQAYARAWRARKTFDIATNLGHAEFKQGKFRGAAEHFSFALNNYPVTAAVQSQREGLRRAFEQARREVAVLHVRVSVDGAHVTVDRVLVGDAPLADAVFVDAGPHEIGATHAGYRAGAAHVDARKGQDQDVVLTLEADATSRPVGARHVGWIIGGGVLAASGIALGVAGLAASNGSASDAQRLQGAIGGGTGACASTIAGDCAALETAAKSRRTWSGVSAAGFITGGVFALGTAGLAIWDATRGEPARTAGRIEVAPFGGADGAGLLVHGRW